MKKIIVTTTINPPTDAIRAFDDLSEFELVVIGDKKTPSDYYLRRGHYISPDEQDKMYPQLSRLLGWNCIQRRNIGFLIALKMGADVIATVDDDNIPLPGWGSDVLIGKKIKAKSFDAINLAFDPIGATNYPALWHRGFPIQWISDRSYDSHSERELTVEVQADFWNGDPDIDAICRMLYRPNCTFDDLNFPFTSVALAPFNSQNTFLARRLMPFYFMFTGIGRLDDIWGAYYLQAKTGVRPLFCRATVRQDRNVHDLTKDFRLEVIGYEETQSLIEDLISNPESMYKYLPGRTVLSYLNYRDLAEKLL
jgi:hypothetical protein